MGRSPGDDLPEKPHQTSEDGIPAPSGAANLIDTDYVIGEPVDYLTRDRLAQVELALAHYLGVQGIAPPRPA